MEFDLLITSKILNSLYHQPYGKLAGIIYLEHEQSRFPSETKLLAFLKLIQQNMN